MTPEDKSSPEATSLLLFAKLRTDENGLEWLAEPLEVVFAKSLPIVQDIVVVAQLHGEPGTTHEVRLAIGHQDGPPGSPPPMIVTFGPAGSAFVRFAVADVPLEGAGRHMAGLATSAGAFAWGSFVVRLGVPGEGIL